MSDSATQKLLRAFPKRFVFILLFISLFAGSTDAQTSLSFNTEGTKDDYVNVPNGGALLEGDNSWTIEFWMKQTSGGGYPFSFGASRYILFHTAGTIVFYTGNGNIQTVNGSFPLDANWHHYAFVSNGSSNATVYVDGVAKGLQANAHTGYSGMSTEPLTLGSVVSYTEESFDEVRIWDYARSGTEITNGMAACFTGAETGLKLYFQFEDGSGTTVTNLGTSGGTYNGTMVNMETGTDWVSNSGYGGCDTPPCTPPSISAHPSASSDCAGDAASFSVTASGTTLTYQWRENGSNISNGGVYSGATSTTLNISDVTGLNGKSYDVVVTESGSCSSTSNTAGLTVTNNPSISAHPSASSDCAGDATSFSVTASGTTLTYQWRENGSNISNGGVYSGATSTTLNISSVTGLNGKSYDVVVTESGACSSTSTTASLTVTAIPSITGTTPASRICDGVVTLGSTASAGTINWYEASSGGSSLGTGSTFNTPSISSTTTYYVDATDNGCTTASRTSVTATINSLTDLAVSATASNILCEGSTTITTSSSDNGINYYLRDNADDSIIDGPIAADGSGLSFNTGTLSSTTTFNVYGELSGSGNLTFDGADDFIDLGTGITFVGTSAYTVEARIKADNVSSPEKNVVTKHQFGTGNLEFLLRINNGKVLGGIRAGGTDGYITGTTTLVPGTWYDLAVTYDGANLKVYVDGVEDGSTAKTGTVDANSANAYIGGSYNGAGAGAEFYDGAIEEVRIWSVAKSGAEISSNLTTDYIGNETGLVALYEFSDGSGTTLSDETANGHNGTLTNMSGTEWGATAACLLEMTQTATVTIDALTDQTYSVSATSVNQGGDVDFTIDGSETDVNYYLRNDANDTLFAGPIAGTGSAIVINTGVLNETITFNVYQEHTSTSCATEMTQGTQTITVIPVTRHYVDTDAVGANDGSSWADAYTDLQSALAVADASDSVWVAAGTYYPTATTDRTIWFEPADGVKIYGGFAGIETADNQRTNFGVGGANETILSGDIGTQGVDTDNSQHVFNFVTANATNELNGLTITKGYTSGGPIAGGGVYLSSNGGSLSLTDVNFTDNWVAWDGAGMVAYGSSDVYMTRVSFTGGYAGEEGGGFELNSSGTVVLNQVDVISNQAAWEGAGGRITSSSGLTIINSKFIGNEMTTTGRPYGGGIEINGVTGSIVNTIISGNKSMNFGGGIRVVNSTLDIINSTIVANEATGNGGGISISGGTLNLKNTIIWDNEHSNITGDQSASIYQEAAATINYTNSLVEAYNPGGTNLDGTNAGNDPLFTTAVDLSVTATPTTSGDFSIQNGSPVKDAGDNVLLPADEFDLDGDANTAEALPIDLIGNNRSAGVVDMGSYENQTSNQVPTLTSFSGAVDTGLEDTEVETTFADLQTAGDENDPDGTVDAFKVISVDSGTLKIGTSSGTATAYATSTNDLINASLNAYWTASANNNGATVNAFEVIAVDNEGAESSTNVMATINITAVNDAPAFTATGDVTVSEDFGTTESVTVTPSAVPSDESGQTVTYSLSPASVSFADVSINASTGEVTITAVADSVGTQLFTITADDAQGANNTHDETFTLTVNAVNDAPAFTTTGDVTVSEDFGTTETVTVTPDAVPTDESGQTVTYSLSPASVSFANVSINTSTGEVTITSVADSIGTQLFTITADDGEGANNTHDETFTLTVNAVNDAPSFTTTGDVTVSEDFGTTESVTVTPDAVPTDELGQTVTYSLSPASVSFADVSINASTGEVTITAVADSVGTQLFTITADDAQGANNTHDETFTLTVNAVNDAPAFTTTGDVTVSEDFGTTESVTVTPDAVPTDELGQTVTYSLSPASVSFANVSINTSTGEVTITAVADSVGTQLFTITADDAQGANNTHDETFTLTVNAVNDAPAFTTTGDVTVSEDFGTTESVTVTPSAVPSDESGQTVTYSLSPASVSFADVSINTSTGEVTITAVADSIGTQLFTITADDGEGANNTHDETFTLTVNAVNDAPSFTTTGDVTVSEDFGTTETVTVTPDAVPTDESGQTVTYSLSPASVSFANVSINTSTGEVTITAVADSIGTQLFTITADDGEGANNTHDETFTLTVNAVNDAPAFTTTGDVTVSEDFGTTETVTVTPDAIPTDELGQTVTYSLSPASVSFANVSISTSTGEVTITAVADSIGTQLFTITADDGEGANNTHDETFTLTVNAVNDDPSVDVNNGLTLDEGATLVITTSELSASDVDNISSELTYTVTTSPVNGIVVRSSDTNSAITSFTQSEVEANEILYKHDDSETTSDSFVFTIADNAGGSASGVTFNITINPVDDTAPVISSLSPLDGATGVASVGGSFDITFSENIFKGTGVISFKRTSDDSIVGTVMVSSGNVSITGATASITTSFNRGCDEDIYIEIGSDVFVDGNSNNFAGVAPAAWNFVTNEAPVIIPGSIIITDNTSCDVTNNGALDASNAIQLDGGASAAGNYTFQWYEGAGTGGTSAGTTASISALTSGSYTLVVTHTARGCESDAVTVTLNDDFTDPPIISPSVSALTDCASDNGSVSATASSTSEPSDYTFKLYEGVGTGGTVLTNLVAAGNVGFTTASLASGQYTIEVINNSTSCNATQVVTVDDDRILPTINSGNVSINNLSECGTGDGSIDISGAIEESSVVQNPANYTFTWYEGSGTGGTVVGSASSITSLSDGIYTVEVVSNSSSCSVVEEFTLVVDDQIDPTVVTQDITVQLDASGAATIATTDIDNGSSDACGIASQSLDVSSFDCSHVGTPQVVTLTVTDNNGNINTGTATVTVSDTLSATVVTQDITVQLDASGASTITAGDIDNGSSDACGIASQSLDVSSFDCSHVGTPQVVTLTVTDNNGNINTGTATVTVADTVSATVVTQDITVQLDASGAATISTTDIDNGSSDACGIASQSLDVSSFDCSHVGTPQVVTLTVTDNNGNTNTGTATVTVEDNVLPTVVTQDITVQLDAAGAATIATTDIDNGSSDACGIASQSLDVSSFDCSHVGTPQVVTLTVTDNNGNINTGTATVTVSDTLSATVVTQDITVQLDASGAATITAGDINNGSSDACGIASQSLDVSSFDCSHVGTPQVVTLTVTDNNGNINTGTATVTVADTLSATVVTQDITVQLDASGAATITAGDIDNGSSDACGIASQSLDVSSFDCSHVGTPQVVTLTVTDNNGNINTGTATVTVADTVSATVVTQDITVQLDASGAATISTIDIDNGSSDACGIASQSLDVSSFDCSHVGTPQVVTLTVTDNNGNINTGTATVTVADTLSATVVTQDITVQLDASGAATITTGDIDNGSSDACGIASQSLDVTSFDCSHIGTPQVVTLTVTDNNGNINTGTATVTVEDNVLPVAIAQDITVQLDASGVATITAQDIDNGSSDACGIATQTLNVTSFDCSHIGTPQVVTLTVTDNNGNENTATATVTVEDSVLPTVVTQDITVQLDASGAATISTTDINNGSSDACGIVSQSLDVTSFDCSHIGTPQVVTLTVTDNNGNENTATATVTVEDSVLPTVVTQDITVQLDASGAATISTGDIDNGSSDACGIASQSLDVSSFDCSHIGTPQVVTLTVTDNNGNINTGTATVTVADTLSATVVTQDITVQLDASGAATISTGDIDNGSSDACGIASQSLDVTSFDCSHIGTPQVVTLTVTDNNGNINTGTATVTVADTLSATVVTQDITVQLDASGAATITAGDIDNGSSDACGIASQSLDVSSFDCSHVGTPQVVTLTVTDNNGNINTGTATVTVEDNVLPVAIAQNITVQLDASGVGTITAQDIDNGSSDACGIATQTLNVTSFDCSHIGTLQEVILTVTDNNGNVNSDTVSVTVADTLAPVFEVQTVTVALDADGNGSITVKDLIASQEDCLSFTASRTTFDCADSGSVQVEVTGVDAGGNETVKTINVVINDDAPRPQFELITDATVQCDGGSVNLIPVHNQTGNALRLLSGGHAVTPHSEELNMNKTSTFSIEAWIRPESTQRGTILSKMLTNNPYTGYELFYENGKVGYHLIQQWTGSTIYGQTNAVNLSPGQWHHVAMTYDGNSVIIYVNGVKATQNLIHNSLNGSMANSSGLYIGSRGGVQFPFIGSIDEVRLWNHSRSKTQIERLKDVRIDHKFEGLIAYYDFEGVQDNVVPDVSNWNHSMTLNGNATFVNRVEKAMDTTLYSYELVSDAVHLNNNAASFIKKNYVSFKSPALNGATTGSIEMRVKWNGQQMRGYGSLYGSVFSRQRDNAYSNAIIGLTHADPNQARLVWRPFNASQNKIVSSTTLDNEWHHLVITFSQGTHSMYLDGVLVGTAKVQGAMRDDPRNPFALGAWIGGGNSFSAADIDNVRIWKKALTETEVQGVKNDFNLTSNISDLGVYYDFESYAGNNIIEDKSGSGAKGQVVNGLSTVTIFNPIATGNELTNSLSFSITESGHHGVKVTNKVTGCSVIGSVYINLGTNPKPVIRPTSNPNTCGQMNVNLEVVNNGGQGVTGYQWYKNGYKIDGEINTNYAATSPGKYAVEITNSLGCPGLSNNIQVGANQPIGAIEGDFKQYMCGNSHTFTVKHENGSLFILQYYDSRYRRWFYYGRWSRDPVLEARQPGYYRAIIRSRAGCTYVTGYKQLYRSRSYNSYITDENGRRLPAETVADGSRQTYAFTGQRLRSYYRYRPTQVNYSWEREGEVVGTEMIYEAREPGTHRLIITDKVTGCEFKSTDIEVYNGVSVALENPSGVTELCGESIRLKAEIDAAPDQLASVEMAWYINGRSYATKTKEIVVTNSGRYQMIIRYKGQIFYSNAITITNPSMNIRPRAEAITYCPGKSFINGKISDYYQRTNARKGTTYYYYYYDRGWRYIAHNRTGSLEVRRAGYYGMRAKSDCGVVSSFVYRRVYMNYCGRWYGIEDIGDEVTMTEALPSIENEEPIDLLDNMKTMVHVEMTPQPAVDHANISIIYSSEENIESVEIKLFDMTGRLLTSRKLSDVNSGYSETLINVADLANGVYLYSIESTGSKISSGKFIIRK